MKNKKKILFPRLGKWLIKSFLPFYESEYFLNDLEEAYLNRVKEMGRGRVFIWLIAQLGFSIPPIIIDNIRWSLIMFKNYLKVLGRNIRRNKIYSFINIGGLAVGLAGVILIYLFIDYELSFDKYHENAEEIFFVMSKEEHPSNTNYTLGTQFPFTEAMRTDFPQLVKIAQVYFQEEVQVKVGNELYPENNIVFTEPDYLDMLDYKILTGNSKETLDAPNSIYLTEDLAKKYFGSKSPVGEIITLNNTIDMKVQGIISTPPSNSNIRFTMLGSIKSLIEDYVGFPFNDWNLTTTANTTLVMLPNGMNPVEINKGLVPFAEKYLSERDREIQTYSLLPLLDLHYDTRFQYANYTTSMDTIYTFALIGLLILAIASINFVNLSTAQAVKRAKEVGVRKVLGANRAQLIRQYLSESLNYTFVAIILALIIAGVSIGKLNDFFGNGIKLELFGNFNIIIFLVVVFFLVGLLTGIYPAMVLSRFDPARTLKTTLSSTKRRFISLRDSLVGIQFVIAQALLIAVIVIASQMDMIKNKDLGFNKESIINVSLPEPDQSKMDVLKNKLLSNHNIQGVSYSLGPPTSGAIMQTYCSFDSEGEQKREFVQAIPTDENYLNLYGIKMLAGDNYRRYVDGDTLYKYIINETMMKKMGIIDPNEAIGKPLAVSRFRGDVMGVVNDFHLRSLHEVIPPTILTNFIVSFFRTTNIKISPHNVPATLDFVESTFKDVFPGYIYDMQFYDEFLGELYEAEERIFTTIQVFTILAIIIGCLGLFGLMSFIAVQKTKEIGIRKVLGASVPNILLHLSKQFSKVIIISNLIAWPLAYYVMNKWLENFAFKIEIGVLVFIIAGAAGLLIAAVSIGFQAVKAAMANPVNSLHFE